MVKRNVILFSSHLLGDTVLARLAKLRSEVPANHDVIFYYDETKLRFADVKHRATPVLAHGSDDWLRYKRPSHYFPDKIPGNVDGMLLSAFHRLPDYDNYWYLEYDVVYSGDWGNFFANFVNNTADMLSTSITRHDQFPDWPLWKSLELPGEITLPPQKWLRSFNPILRLSKQALETLTAEYSRHAWAGHFECVIPTVLKYRGLRIEDIGGEGEFVPEGSENRHYRNNRLSKALTPGTFVFRPPMMAPGLEPDLLWHPVKDANHRTWDRASGKFAPLLMRLQGLLKR